TKDVDKCAECIIRVTEEVGIDGLFTLVDLSVEAADWGEEVIYYEDKAAGPDYDKLLIKTPADYDKVVPINTRETPRMKDHLDLCRLLVEKKGHELPVIAFVFGPLGILSMLRGHDKIFKDMLKKKDLVHKALRVITDCMIDYCDAIIETGVHAIMFDTLFASRSILSKPAWDEFEGVYMEEIANHLHAKNCPVMIHNCGAGVYFDIQIKRINPCLISYMNIPDDCTSMEDIKEKYGKDITLMGHIEPAWLMDVTKEEVFAECKKQIDAYKKDGGFILATGCEYPAPLGFEQGKWMVEAAELYGKY
ncbi:MAG: uroporphyrinogen decarboxylase family protein, partial [Clostridiales bacterium]